MMTVQGAAEGGRAGGGGGRGRWGGGEGVEEEGCKGRDSAMLYGWNEGKAGAM